MARIPQSVIEEVRERADIVSVIGRYVTLRQAGSQHVGLCPFHDEKTPSFQVSPAKQVFYCFGCQAGGNVFSFLMRRNGLEFHESVTALAKELGIRIPASGGQGSGRSAALFRISERALEFFRETYRGAEGKAARAHLAERGVPDDLADRFSLGCAPARWDGLLKTLPNAEAVRAAAEVGLVKARETGSGHYDGFRGRVIFPIAEPGGRVIGFGGRALSDDGPKYINSPESPIYRKGNVLFGIHQALDAIRQRRRAIVVEGYFDVMALHRAGLAEAVAPCGTALTAAHARLLRRYAPEVVLLFDGDEAGQRAALRSLPQLLAEGLRVRAAFLPAGDDPDTLVRRAGEAGLRACVEAATPLLDELIDREVKGMADHAWDAADAARALAPYILAIPDAVEKAAYTRKLSSYLDLPPEALASAMRSAAAAAPPERAPQAPAPPPPERVPDPDPAIAALLGAVLEFPETGRHLDDLQSDWLPREIDREVVSAVSAALASHGHAAASHLLSPENPAVRAEVAAALAWIAAQDPPESLDSAERAAGDCIAQLERKMLDARIREIKARAAGEDEAQFETLQRYMHRRLELVSSLARPPSP